MDRFIAAMASEQPDTLVVALGDQAMAVVFDFVDPAWVIRNIGGTSVRGIRKMACHPTGTDQFSFKVLFKLSAGSIRNKSLLNQF